MGFMNRFMVSWGGLVFFDMGFSVLIVKSEC